MTETAASHHVWETILIALQAIQLVAMPYHDMIPLGPLNNVHSFKETAEKIPFRDFVLVTLAQVLPIGVGLYFSVLHYGGHWPGWLVMFLWGYYGVMFALELRSFWLPYFFYRDEARIAKYRVEFANTHAFLPERNGIVPNTLHTIIHSLCAVTLVALYFAHL
jgi:hypothetical protein